MPGENSYSHHTDMDVGVAIIDRFTFFALEFFETVQRGGNATMADFLAFMGCAACNDRQPRPRPRGSHLVSALAHPGLFRACGCFMLATSALMSLCTADR